MKWVTYDAGTGPRTGVLDEETVRGLPAGVTLLSLLGDDGDSPGPPPRRLRSPADVRPLT